MAEAPLWFSQALAQSPEQGSIFVEGATVQYRAWGRRGDPIVVLVHGGAAHAGWWDHLAPYLASTHRVLAPELSGHGDSDWRASYSLETWAEEVMALVEHEGTSVRSVIFGHSMGGAIALTAARLFGSRLSGVVAIDSQIRELSPEIKAWFESGRLSSNRVYATFEENFARFRTLPEDAATLPYVRAHVAKASIKQVQGGFTWKFDPAIFFRSIMQPEEIAEVICDVVLIRGERGLATRDITTDVAERLRRYVPVTVVLDSGHHIMLDQPLALLAALQTLLGQWTDQVKTTTRRF